MTREQAIETYLKAGRIDNLGSIQHQLDTGRLIDGLAALGLIKVDEMATPRDRFIALYNDCSCCELVSSGAFLDRLATIGLKIVEK